MTKDRFLAELRRIAWPLLAVFPPLVAMHGMWSVDRFYFYRDLGLVFWPLHAWLRNTIAAGTLPLWDPYMSLGQSAIADPVRLILFPPVMALRLFLPAVLGYNLSVGLPFPIAALGVYVLLRRYLSAPSSALGGALFATSAPVLATANMLNLSWAAGLVPWVVLALLRLASQPTVGRLAVAATAVALQALAGEPVTLAMTSVSAVFLSVALEKSDARTALKRAFASALAVAVGGMLAAIQYLPLADAASRSRRASPDMLPLTLSLNPLRLLELVYPMPFGNTTVVPGSYLPWVTAFAEGRESIIISLYLGCATLLLAAVGGAFGDRRRVIVWGTIGTAALLCALGEFTPLLPALQAVLPLLRSFRYPEKYLTIATLATCVLAAEGFEVLLRRRFEGRLRAVPVVVLVVVFGAVAWYAVEAPGIARSLGLGDAEIEELRGRLQFDAPHVVGVALGALALLLIANRQRVALVGLYTVAVLDLILIGVTVNPQAPVSLTQKPTWAIDCALSGRRVYIGGREIPGYRWGRENGDALPPGVNLPGRTVGENDVLFYTLSAVYPSGFGVHEVISYDSTNLLPNDYNLTMHAFANAPREARSLFLDRLGVRQQVLPRVPLGDYGPGTSIPQFGPAASYVSDRPFTRAEVVPSYRVDPDGVRAAFNLFLPDFDPSAVAVLDREPSVWGTPGGEEGSVGARIVEDSTNSKTIEATAAGPSVLVLRDAFNPGWQVTVDGRPAELLCADGLFCAVPLESGRHTVELRYLPKSLVVGAVVTLVTAAALAALCIAARVRRANSSAPEATRDS